MRSYLFSTHLKGKLNGPIWVKPGETKTNKSFDFFQSSTKLNITNLNTPKELNMTQQNGNVIIYGNHARNNHFFYKAVPELAKALVICRTEPIVPVGIQTLNMILDPSKSEVRAQKVKETKKKFYEDFGQLDIEKSYEKLFELLWYTRLPCFDVQGITSKQKDEMSVIKRCYWRGKMVDCASVFVTRSTDRGMCCSFNQINADLIYKNISYRRAASIVQQQDRENSFIAENSTTR